MHESTPQGNELMSKKPTAALSANLVAVKGTAIPAPDISGRATSPTVSPSALDDTAPVQVGSEPPLASAVQAEGGWQPLNFRVPDAFRREFKVYAARNGLKLNELLRLSFEAYRRQNGQ
jgi:hypothetical protein